MSELVTRPEILAPHSREAEEAVLGAVLINPDSLRDIEGFLVSADFFILRNRYVMDAILAVSGRGEAIDNLTVRQELLDQGKLADVGGDAYLTQLLNNTPTHIHAETYARIVERASIRRRLLRAASNIARASQEANESVEDVLDFAESEIYNVSVAGRRKDMPSLRQIVSETFDEIEAMYNRESDTLGIPTGFTDLDVLLSGLEKSRLYILAGRPGMGKTALMCNIASAAAKTHKQRVGFFSLEMNRGQLVIRLSSAETGINSKKLRLGRMDKAEWSRYIEASGRIENWPLEIDDTGGINMIQVRARMRKWQREKGLDLVVLDYLQLAHASGQHGNREGEVSEIARGLKELAREFDIPVLAAAQLNRGVESRQDKKPVLSDLRESGEIENAADVVMFIYRPVVYDEHCLKPNQADVIVAKNRDGETGTAELNFIGATTLFTNAPQTKKQHIDLRNY